WPSLVFGQFRNEGRNSTLDVVTDGANRIDPLTCGVVELPVFVAFAREVWAGVPAAHGDDHVSSLHGLCGEYLGLLGGDVDAFFKHRRNRGRGDMVGGHGACRAHLDPVPSEVAAVAGGHLRAPGVVYADEQYGGFGVSHDSELCLLG